MSVCDILHYHAFFGIGAGAAGFNDAAPRVGTLAGNMVCIGGFDVDVRCVRDFERMTGTPGTQLDAFSLDQYVAFHGNRPPPAWREATPADIHRSAGHRRPHIVFLSAPCKGLSGLLPEARAATAKYMALNELTLRGVWLMLEAWGDDPPELVVFENVPRIASRGRFLLDQIFLLMRHYGYVGNETTHDCGEIGHLAQSRRRYLGVFRHERKVPAFLYQPERRPLRPVGDVLGKMVLPGDERAGPMHRVPNLQWQTWVRLAFVQAGSDWRSLNRLQVHNGMLRDYLIVPENAEAWHPNVLGVTAWDRPAGTVTSESRPTTGRFAVADPRFAAHGNDYRQYGVVPWQQPMGAVINVKAPGQGAFAVADPRCPNQKHNNCFRVVKYDQPSGTVTGGGHPSAGGQSVADPRGAGDFSKYEVTAWQEPARTVISGSTTGQGAYAVADPRPGIRRVKGDHYLTAGHYGVVPWSQPAGAVSAAASHDNGHWSVADPRMPAARDKLVAVIRAEDGSWHRPFTTLELAALQGLFDPEDHLVHEVHQRWKADRVGVPGGLYRFELDGTSDTRHREAIGNAVPRKAAKAIGKVMGETLLLAWSGETFVLNAQPVWVKPMALALTLPGSMP